MRTHAICGLCCLGLHQPVAHAAAVDAARQPLRRLLCPQVEGIGTDEPLSEEKLCPVLAMYRARDFDDAIAKADKLVGGRKGLRVRVGPKCVCVVKSVLTPSMPMSSSTLPKNAVLTFCAGHAVRRGPHLSAV